MVTLNYRNILRTCCPQTRTLLLPGPGRLLSLVQVVACRTPSDYLQTLLAKELDPVYTPFHMTHININPCPV